VKDVKLPLGDFGVEDKSRGGEPSGGRA